MPTLNQQRQRDAFQDALRRPKREPSPPAVQHGPTAERVPDRSVFLLGIHRIQPDEDQVRTANKSAEDAGVRELAESIKAVGLENPLLVRWIQQEDIYELIAGERRLAAAKLAGLTDVPVKLIDADEPTVRRLQLHENVHRASLTPIELGTALQSLLDQGETPESLARLLCKSTAHVQKALTVARQLAPAAQQIADSDPGRFSSLDILYDIAQCPADRQAELLTRLRDDGLTRDELRTITAPLKAAANADQPTRGRKSGSRPYQRRIQVENGATVSVTFRKTTVTDTEILLALRQAMNFFTQDVPGDPN